jgi:hypothetical protein
MDASTEVEAPEIIPVDLAFESSIRSTTAAELRRWLRAPEGARIEFKEAKHSFNFDKLVQYVVALANERGDKIILGAFAIARTAPP